MRFTPHFYLAKHGCIARYERVEYARESQKHYRRTLFMVTRLICLAFLLCHAAGAGMVTDLKQVRTSEDLARYISSMMTNDAALGALLDGLGGTNSIRPAPYSVAIPVREICGTIIAERFGAALGGRFYMHEKMYGAREICAFRDEDGTVCRYHVGIFEERQYRLMKDLLRKKLAVVGRSNALMTGGSRRFPAADTLDTSASRDGCATSFSPAINPFSRHLVSGRRCPRSFPLAILGNSLQDGFLRAGGSYSPVVHRLALLMSQQGKEL